MASAFFTDLAFGGRGSVVGQGQKQRERPQDKIPKNLPKNKVPEIEQVEIEPVDDLLQELEELKKRENKRCGCWGD
jgi:hypothetical protein